MRGRKKKAKLLDVRKPLSPSKLLVLDKQLSRHCDWATVKRRCFPEFLL